MLKTKYDTDKSQLEKKISDTSGLSIIEKNISDTSGLSITMLRLLK